MTKGFLAITWSPVYATHPQTNDDAVERARGFVDAAAQEAGVVASTAGVLDASGVKPELWEHVEKLMTAALARRGPTGMG